MVPRGRWSAVKNVGTLVLCLSASLLACSDAPPVGGDAVALTDSAGIRIATNDLSRLSERCSLSTSPRLSIGDRVDDSTHQLYRVFGATVLSDGRVAVVNQGSQELRFYSATGDLLSTSGREGQGPGEFQSAFLLWKLPGDTLWVGDYRPWEFEVFAPDGTWVRAVRPAPTYGNPPRGFGILSDGRMVLASSDITERDPNFEVQSLYLSLHSTDGALVDTVGVLPNGRWGQTIDDPRSMWLFPWFESFAEVGAGGARLFLGHGSDAELRIYRVAEELELETLLRWSGLDLTVTDSDVRAAKGALEDRYVDLEPAMRSQLLEPLVHDDRPVAETFPAFIKVMAGSDDSIWIKLYSRPGEKLAAQWVRFDRDGRFVCHLDIPARIEVYEFGEDYLLGKEKGGLDVEIVSLYELSSGG